MDIYKFVKRSRKDLFKAFEKERQKCLALGMSEANIFRMHFGKGGDYETWLALCASIRTDHKYCPGRPTSTDEVDQEGVCVSGNSDELDEVEVKHDFNLALKYLTKMQRFCLVEVKKNHRTQQSVADELGIARQNVSKHIKAAKKKLKIFYR